MEHFNFEIKLKTESGTETSNHVETFFFIKLPSIYILAGMPRRISIALWYVIRGLSEQGWTIM